MWIDGIGQDRELETQTEVWRIRDRNRSMNMHRDWMKGMNGEELNISEIRVNSRRMMHPWFCLLMAKIKKVDRVQSDMLWSGECFSCS